MQYLQTCKSVWGFLFPEPLLLELRVSASPWKPQASTLVPDGKAHVKIGALQNQSLVPYGRKEPVLGHVVPRKPQSTPSLHFHAGSSLEWVEVTASSDPVTQAHISSCLVDIRWLPLWAGRRWVVSRPCHSGTQSLVLQRLGTSPYPLHVGVPLRLPELCCRVCSEWGGSISPSTKYDRWEGISELPASTP